MPPPSVDVQSPDIPVHKFKLEMFINELTLYIDKKAEAIKNRGNFFQRAASFINKLDFGASCMDKIRDFIHGCVDEYTDSYMEALGTNILLYFANAADEYIADMEQLNSMMSTVKEELSKTRSLTYDTLLNEYDDQFNQQYNECILNVETLRDKVNEARSNILSEYESVIKGFKDAERAKIDAAYSEIEGVLNTVSDELKQLTVEEQ